ncbi:hypothetical protein AZE42_12262 [Rhizopogon vesiculosus]|uniref:Uncharacterized protein n=1 Tax=Rhizopogon vesiculosus TaxID=180088 RepID=A0A1J8PM45_9AGAM|nr:hypothetical protein AZE42_12262 [Rhizopogon vesiculosus]
MPGIPFTNPSFSPPLHDLLNTSPCDHPIDVAVPPSWLYADLFLNAAMIIEKQESPAPPEDTTSTLVIEFFTTANGDHDEPGAQRCCFRRMLYNEPDFTNIKSTLELTCESPEISVLFLAKFHCELSFIEQCWGHAKRTYRLRPPSTSEEALEKNPVDVLESVTVEQMRRYARRSRRSMDAYQKGLTGKHLQ